MVARRDDLVVVVEVRTRGPGSFQRPFESIDAKKRMRLLHATERLLRGELARLKGVARVRIDAAAVALDDRGASVEYVEGAVTRG